MTNNMSYVLALNSAEGFLQFAIGSLPGHTTDKEPGRSVKHRSQGLAGLQCSQEWRLPSQGAEIFIPALEGCLNRLGAHVRQVKQIACVTGPGSFTGIRLATSSAAGLAQATGAVMAGLDYLPLLAANAVSILGPSFFVQRQLWAVTHARRDLVHAQVFAVSQPTTAVGVGLVQEDDRLSPVFVEQGGENISPCKALSKVLVLKVEELIALVGESGQQAVLFGSGVSRNREQLERSCAPLVENRLQLLGPQFDTPLPATLFEAACQAQYTHEELVPVYIRPSDAEESLDQIAAKLGLDVEKVLAAYNVFQQG